MNWVKEELSRANLGYRRINKRLIKIVSDLAEQTHESVPQASREVLLDNLLFGIVARLDS